MRSTSRLAWSRPSPTPRAARPWSRSSLTGSGYTRSGRLDIDTTGLILVTNDGELAHRLTHPSFEVPKTYRAVVAGAPVREAALRAAARRSRARGGSDGACARQAPRARHDRAHHSRGTKAPGTADVRVGGPPRAVAGASELWPAEAGSAGAGRLPAAHRRRDRAAQRGWRTASWTSSSSVRILVAVSAGATSLGVSRTGLSETIRTTVNCSARCTLTTRKPRTG